MNNLSSFVMGAALVSPLAALPVVFSKEAPTPVDEPLMSYYDPPPFSPPSEELIYFKLLSMKPYMKRSLARKISKSVAYYAEEFHHDPELLLAVMATESYFNPKARSSTGAVGLMQVMPFWPKQIDLGCDLWEVDCNVRYGAMVLSRYKRRYPEVELALAAYNQGPERVQRSLDKGSPVGTHYSHRVLSFRKKIDWVD